MDKLNSEQIRIKVLNKGGIGKQGIKCALTPKPWALKWWLDQIDLIKRGREMSDSNLMNSDNLANVSGSLEMVAQNQIGAADCTSEAWYEYFSEPCMDRILDSDLMNETINEAFANSNVDRNEVYTMSLLRRCCADIANDFAEA